ncbi:MAG: RnfABCDGE type electron transport complex subunit G [Desulfatiglans sp.]|jgi:electron transport complex protein RnfG|nr:RnfABCDGE type electron transport complex subunit G [Desulfatiglans sp.]
MRDVIKLFLIVTIFSAVSGWALATVRNLTAERVEIQQLTYIKGPALKEILAGSTNDPITDRLKVPDGKKQIDVFTGVFDSRKNTVAFEVTGKGYGGNIGIMVAFNIETDELAGIGVTTHSETPGLGARAKTEPSFRAQFKGISINKPVKVRPEGGDIDALSGATVTSKGVCSGVNNSIEIYKRVKSEILKNIKG